MKWNLQLNHCAGLVIWLCFKTQTQYRMAGGTLWSPLITIEFHRHCSNFLWTPGRLSWTTPWEDRAERLQVDADVIQPFLSTNHVPKVDRYFTRRLCLWMPKKMWKARLVCPSPECNNRQLMSVGLYQRVRQVLDVDNYYYLGTEYLQYGRCSKKVIGWSEAILQQLDVGQRYMFPAILTHK